MAGAKKFQYPTSEGARALVVEAGDETAESIVRRLSEYFDDRKIEFHCDRVRSIQDALLQLKYYDYDVAIVSMRPAKDESASEFLDLVRKRKYEFPVILFGEEGERPAALSLSEKGAIGYFFKRGNDVRVAPEAVDNGILIFRTICKQSALHHDLVEKNQELKAVNELLARQSVRLIKTRKEQESQRRTMESLLHSMSEAVVFVNSRGKIEMTNPAARRAFGIAGGAKFEMDDLRAMTGLNPMEITPGVETPLLLLSRNYRMTSTEVEYEGERMGRMLVMHDVTRETEMERVKAEFQSMVSHELRTPLMAIRGAAENFLRGTLGVVTERQKSFLEMILRNVERQTALVNGILDLAKLQAKMMTLRPILVEPARVVRLSLETFQPACKEKGIKLQMDVPAGIPNIYADEAMLTQIMDNLLSNAVKFTPTGGWITIVVGKTASDLGEETVTFTVSDSGIGVPETLRERIFESYFQADSGVQRQYKGTGLGLSISRKMAELHNGALTCRAAPSGGSRFDLTIPVNLSRRKKVFLATDAENRLMDEDILGREFNVLKADSEGLVVETILSSQPRLIMLDYHAGAEDVMKIFSIIKLSQQTAGIPVIFMGKNLTEKEKTLLLKMGAYDVLARPCTAGEFLARVKTALGEKP